MLWLVFRVGEAPEILIDDVNMIDGIASANTVCDSYLMSPTSCVFLHVY